MTSITSLLWIIIFSPVVSLGISSGLPRVRETAISRIMMAGVLAGLLGGVALAFVLFLRDLPSLTASGPILWQSREHSFALDLHADPSGLTYLILASFLTTMVIIFSKPYLHREEGYKRFFLILGCFYLGITIVVLAGNLEVLFLGWEIVGVTSFFLISFYHERYLAVKNAYKVVSLYRVADVSMLVGIWIIHHHFPHFHFGGDPLVGNEIAATGAACTFLLAALVKSGQFPFSFWVPRAMEGPTTSSAIFYGALSTHLGVFLLLRTEAFWQHNLILKLLIGSLGLLTYCSCKWMSWVQATVKAKIGYSSVAQIGLIFIEVACGWFFLAHLHLVLNSLFRCYQILVSPSTLNYQIQNQIFLPKKRAAPPASRWNCTLYVLAVHEFYLDRFFTEILWHNLKAVGSMMLKLRLGRTGFFVLLALAIGSASLYWPQNPITRWSRLPEAMVRVGWIFIFRSLSTRGPATSAWGMLMANQLFLFLALWLESNLDPFEGALFLTGVIFAGALGYLVLTHLHRSGAGMALDQFHGHAMRHPVAARLFVFAVLAIAGFPITPTFLGEELMLSHIADEQWILMLMIIVNLVLDGLVGMALYCKIFLGGGRTTRPPLNFRAA